MTGWALAIAVGTSFTVAAVASAGRRDVLQVGPDRYLPSAVGFDARPFAIVSRQEGAPSDRSFLAVYDLS